MPNVYDAAASYRQQLLARDQQAAIELTRAYQSVWLEIKKRLDVLTAQIRDAEAAGEAVTPGWLFQRDRLTALQQQVEDQLARFALQAAGIISQSQADAVHLASWAAPQLARDALGSPTASVAAIFAHLPSSTVLQLVGTLQPQSPLRGLLDSFGPEASVQIRRELVNGLAIGRHPLQIASRIKRHLDNDLYRARLISRSATLGSYREASRLAWVDDQTVATWVWLARLDGRTCPFCWSMNGSIHPKSERFATHPGCRCTAAPKSKTIPGLPDNQPTIEPGADVFARLDPLQQREILGPAKFRAYQDGALTLDDVRGFRTDKQWGRVGYERSLRDILKERAQDYLRAA